MAIQVHYHRDADAYAINVDGERPASLSLSRDDAKTLHDRLHRMMARPPEGIEAAAAQARELAATLERMVAQ